jgi:two-component system, LytTR family, sensor kinase
VSNLVGTMETQKKYLSYFVLRRAYFLLMVVVAVVLWAIYQLQDKAVANDYDTLFWSILHTVGLWMGCYFTVSLLWKWFPWEINPLKHLILEVLLIGLYTNLFVYTAWQLYPALAGSEYHENVFDAFLSTNLITFLITAIHEAVFFYRQWMENFSKSVRLEKENIQARYEALKTQINPHFLFNSLNSLTALVDNNPQAVDYIQNLSQFLRYVLKSRDRELVTLGEEMEMLNQYIALQKTRLADNAVFTVDVPENFHSFGMPPLALQMLVENCLKHNVASRSHILQVEVVANGRSLTVRNNIQPKHGEPSTGYGLQNLTERYGFFTKQPVTISSQNGTFTVVLPLLDMSLT